MASVQFSPDGRTVATAGGAFNTARLWNASTGKPVATLTGHTGAVTAVAFSPDGTMVATASADRTARLWNATHRRAHHHPRRAHGQARHGAIQPTWRCHRHGKRRWDGTVWTGKGQFIATVRAAVDRPGAIAFGPDGAELATGGAAGRTQVWRSPIAGDPVDTLCTQIGRPMTEQEWSAHVPFLPYQPSC